MNFQRSQSFAAVARWFCAALAAVVFSGAVHAEPAVAGRWLLVFDTSYPMKKRLPATLLAASNLVATSASGLIRKNDSVAVWTYNQQLTSNQLPPIAWNPARSAVASSNLVAFLKRQRFGSESKLSSLETPLARVIASSERLTIVIFCDGLSEMSSTPYDEGINQSFHNSQAERAKSRQPFVVVLRTQLGKYVGCTVGYPPNEINFPPFPELPPPVPVKAPVKAPVAALPPANVPSLVIIGTKVGTNLDSAPETVSPPAGTNMAAPVKPVVVVPTNPPITPVIPPPVHVESNAEKAVIVPVPPPTNAMTIASPVVSPAPATHPAAAPAVIPPVTPPAVAAPTAPVVAPDKDGERTRLLIWVGAGLLVTAIVLVVLLLRANRRPPSSLITSSMQDAPPRREVPPRK